MNNLLLINVAALVFCLAGMVETAIQRKWSGYHLNAILVAINVVVIAYGLKVF